MAVAPNRSDIANANALERLVAARPFFVGVRRAGELIPELGETDFLHAGPPLNNLEEACGALQGAIEGTIVHLGLAGDLKGARALIKKNAIRLLPAQDFNALGTFGGVISKNTPLLVVENRHSGTQAYAAINEGRGKALRYGSNDQAALRQLAWLESDFAEMLRIAIDRAEGIELLPIISQAIHMGDDGHSRQKAASALFLATIASGIIECGKSIAAIAEAFRFLSRNDFFFLPLAMAAAKSTMNSIEGIANSTIVTSMAFNGVRCGIQLSGHPRKWWTAPIPYVHGKYFEGYCEADAGPVIGDSEIAETMGLGAFAMAAAPGLARYIGGSIEETARFTLSMYRIALAENPHISIPSLSYRGTPLGIDARLVVETGIEPLFSTGIAHKTGGVGQIGAGYGRVPIGCFQNALKHEFVS